MKLTTPSAPAMKAASDLFTVTTEDPAHAGILREVFIETFARKIDSAFEEERASLAELRSVVADFLMTHALEPTRTRPVMPMNTPLAKALLQRARAAVGLTDADLAIHPEELNHTRPSMHYYDRQAARVGDTFVIGTYGTCRIESLQEKVAITRNILTNERFDLDDLSEADLLDRAEERNHTQAMVQAFGEHGQG